MEPIGLTLKDKTENPFTGRISGEIMIVHHCSCCGNISCNRIGGDDNPYAIMDLLESHTPPDGNTHNGLTRHGIQLLGMEEHYLVQQALYGNDSLE